MIMNGELGRRL